MDTISQDSCTRFHDACAAYDISLNETNFSETLEELTKELALSNALRLGGYFWVDVAFDGKN